MSRPVCIPVHALATGAFMYFLQTPVLHATAETGLAWAIVSGLGATALARHHGNR
jgi:hypothetical protein